jgi:drug/metabolite transporter (DMT)-like permease
VEKSTSSGLASHSMYHNAGLAAIALAAILWSTGGLFIKWINLPPVAILTYRAFFASLLFLIVFKGKVLVLTPKIFLVSCFYAVLVGSFVFATKLTTAANAIFLQYTAPLYLIILEPWLFKYKLTLPNFLTAICCMIGMGLFFLDDFSTGGLLGNLLALFSGVMLAGMMLAQRNNPPQHHEASIFWGNSWVVLLGFIPVINAPLPSQSDWFMLAFLGLIQIGLGYILFTFGLKRVSALESSLMAMLEPILNPVWVMIGFGEMPGLHSVIGATVIISALVFRIIYTTYIKK